MEEHQVVPDVLDVIPPNVIEITYPGGQTVSMGNELEPKHVKDIPDLRWTTEEGVLYTLIMTDPDAPVRNNPYNPKHGEANHWLVVNIPGLDIQSGQTLNDYVGAGPPPGCGLHRYIFTIYKQSGVLNISPLPGRRGFKTRDFARKHGLGEPIAGNFFQAQFDRYVPLMYVQIIGTRIRNMCSIM
ncbi:unnamed protein product [Oppiella nova]|uniref:Phosphatidylethanolamine-binding protein n=1 Tax=Oppiella nova TaxID=334625 RepID=A0A7R9M783_9ACAR|nr:unnamed protein product [Oppiella nova]CAG2172086.1 unnamed protein product [Oppiella nova]